ncbi:MAG TPA: alpha amylase C-terminal domain-containing protein, partial [Bacillota bacterium]|nr:alpha amylase C-terminal domain-containing protein [Bacillota bacterium]
GGEYAQFIEWRDYETLDRSVLGFDSHRMHLEYVKELNRLYLEEPALWELDSYTEGFSWIDADNDKQSTASFARRSRSGDYLVCMHNFTPRAYEGYRLGVHEPGEYVELISSDDVRFGGSGVVNFKTFSEDVKSHGLAHSIEIRVPPLGSVVLKLARSGR